MGQYVEMFVQYGVELIKVFALLFLAWVVAGWVSQWVVSGLKKAKIEDTLAIFLGNCACYAVIVISLISILGIFGVETTSFAAVIGSIGFAVGLAFQGTLSNVSSGVMLMIFRPIKVGDVVSVAGQTGKVTEIDLFVTNMDTPDNRRLIIPNSAVFGATIENLTYHDIRRADVSVGVSYTAGLDETRKVLQEAAECVPGRLPGKAVEIVLVQLGTSSVDYQVRIWCKTADYGAVKEAGTQLVKKKLDEVGIGIPVPQMNIHFDSGIKIDVPATS